MKKRLFLAAIAAALIFTNGCGASGVSDAYESAFSQVQEEFDAEFQKQIAAMESASSVSNPAVSDSENLSSVPESSETPDPSSEALVPSSEAESESESDPDAPLESGIYEIDGIRVMYYSSVRNDSTGNWRLGVISDGTDLNTYVVDYYNFFCRDDSEVHGIVNLGLGTTTLISKVMSDTLEISITEYQDGEEHDAKLLFSGDELDRYWINMDTLEEDHLDDDE